MAEDQHDGPYSKDPRVDRFVHWALTVVLIACVSWFATRFDRLESTLNDLGTKFEVQAERLARIITLHERFETLTTRVKGVEGRVFEMNERRISTVEKELRDLTKKVTDFHTIRK